MGDFQRFLQEHPSYKALYNSLRNSREPNAIGRVLAASAQLVHRVHGDALGPVADEILDFVKCHYPGDFADRYTARLSGLAELQRKFDLNPSGDTLCDPDARVARDDYSLSLLLSIILTNHRFEIMAQLVSFIESMHSTRGRIVSIAAGTGYELLHAARNLPEWEIEAYEIDDSIRARAQQLWKFFGANQIRDVGAMFPLDHTQQDFLDRYDAVIMCELCEHLSDPLGALKNVRNYLKEQGRAFVTMAINIAQEDHIFLYPTIDACRDQVRASGLTICSEWITPQVSLSMPLNREENFQKGNYVAVVAK